MIKLSTAYCKHRLTYLNSMLEMYENNVKEDIDPKHSARMIVSLTRRIKEIEFTLLVDGQESLVPEQGH